MLSVISLSEVLQDTPALEHADRLAVRESVGYGWNAAVGVDLQEPWLLLGVFAEFDLVDFVGEAVGPELLALNREEWWREWSMRTRVPPKRWRF